MQITPEELATIIASIKGTNIQSETLTAELRSDEHPFEVGANYFIRTVTHHYTGKLVAVGDKELVITDAAWIADDGRFAQAIATGAFNEVEPFPDGAKVIVGRASLIEAVKVSFQPPRSQK